MQLGILINYFSFPAGPTQLGPTIGEIARTVDESGFSVLGMDDHVWQSPYFGGPQREQLECYTTLGFLAASTRRVRLIPIVTCPSYRHPGLLAKIVTTLDVLSSGRGWLGIGAGDYEDEARGLGLPFPPVSERFEILEETLQICLRMWSGERGDQQPFAGKHFRLDKLINSPQSTTRPHPPILIGGNGEQKTLRLVARYADACNLRPSPEIPHKLDVLRRHCEAESRDYDAIEKTCMFAFDIGEDGSKTDELIGKLRWLAGMGIQTVIGSIPQQNTLAVIERVGRDVLPAVASL